MVLRRFLWMVLVMCAAPVFADAPGVYAITGGTVHPVSATEISNGMVIIRDGLIEAVGANLPIPADATTIDVKGGHVYPGIIDAHTSLGFPAATPPRRGRGAGAPARQQQTPPPLPETSPAFLAVREVKLSAEDVEAKRATGVTTILTAPAFGIFNGQSVVLNLGEGETGSRVIRDAATQQISFSPRPAWTFPDSLMGVIADIKQTLLDAQQYSAAHAIYDRNPSGYRRPEDSAALQALAPVLRRDVPVVFTADSESMMRRAEAIAKEFNLRYILSGARQGYRFADELRASNVPVFVSVKWPLPPANKDDRDETSFPEFAKRSRTGSRKMTRCAPSPFPPPESSVSIANSARWRRGRSRTSSSPISHCSQKRPRSSASSSMGEKRSCRRKKSERAVVRRQLHRSRERGI